MTRILVVDDSAFLRQVLKGYLSGERLKSFFTSECVVSEANSRSEALRKFDQERPHLVLLDIVMDLSERDGIEVLTAIMRAGTGCKVIMMSAVGQDRIIRECMAIGAAGYVMKPFDEQQVYAAVKGALANQPEMPADLHA